MKNSSSWPKWTQGAPWTWALLLALVPFCLGPGGACIQHGDGASPLPAHWGTFLDSLSVLLSTCEQGCVKMEGLGQVVGSIK